MVFDKASGVIIRKSYMISQPAWFLIHYWPEQHLPMVGLKLKPLAAQANNLLARPLDMFHHILPSTCICECAQIRLCFVIKTNSVLHRCLHDALERRGSYQDKIETTIVQWLRDSITVIVFFWVVMMWDGCTDDAQYSFHWRLWLAIAHRVPRSAGKPS